MWKGMSTPLKTEHFYALSTVRLSSQFKLCWTHSPSELLTYPITIYTLDHGYCTASTLLVCRYINRVGVNLSDGFWVHYLSKEPYCTECLTEIYTFRTLNRNRSENRRKIGRCQSWVRRTCRLLLSWAFEHRDRRSKLARDTNVFRRSSVRLCKDTRPSIRVVLHTRRAPTCVRAKVWIGPYYRVFTIK
jgi:hypothetical protein